MNKRFEARAMLLLAVAFLPLAGGFYYRDLIFPTVATLGVSVACVVIYFIAEV